MRSMEFSGHSVDEAIFNGLNEMGVTIDEVEIETIQSESKGLFGIGAKMAVVRLTEREVPLVMEMEQVYRKEKEAGYQRREQQRPVRDARAERGGERMDRPQRQDTLRSPAQRSGNAPRGGQRDASRDYAMETTVEEHYDYSEELAKETPCAVFLGELLAKMNTPAPVLAANTDNGLRLCINAETMGLLIGRRGETLDAMQYLVSLVANKNRKEEGFLRVTLDTEGYRFRREETLKRLARKNATHVRQTGRPVAMEPMNPYERRILHSALQGFTGVTTHSEGEEPNRHVVITPTK
ncbi:MAG: RNA-binding cell elongation regulator Jag/EloR [Eubacteriales bacterium]|nr:RNA-binding cell elongation regulator Jag/EloR [Eubacteriales bacterium]